MIYEPAGDEETEVFVNTHEYNGTQYIEIHKKFPGGDKLIGIIRLTWLEAMQLGLDIQEGGLRAYRNSRKPS